MRLDPELEKELDSLPPEERERLQKMLSSFVGGDPTAVETFLKQDYEEPPVDILQFIDDDQYLGRPLKNPDGSHKVFGYWREALARVFESDAFEVIFTGPIGSGKSTIIEVALAYICYDVVNLHDPFEFYGLIRAQPIVLLFFSLSKGLSEVGLFRGFMELVLQSPWFMERGVLRGVRNKILEFPQKNLEYSLGSPKVPGYGIVGHSVIGGGLDEISEIATVKELEAGGALDLSKMQALKIYQQAVRRMESRFLRDGRLPGKLFLASSKQDEAAFLERYVEEVKGSSYVLVFDDPLWEILPGNRFTGVTFPVVVGGKFKQSKVTTEDEVDTLIEQGEDVIDVPVEYRRAFDLDVVGAMRDIAGITASSTRRSKLIPRAELIERCVTDRMSHPFTHEVIYLSEDDEIGIEDYFQMHERFLTPPLRFIHVDLGLTGDAAGVAMCHVSGQKEVDRLAEDGTSVLMRDNIVTFDFLLRVSNVEGSEIPFWKIRRFIIYLRRKKVRIQLVTFDGWQSSDGRQLLRKAGFESEIVSVDRNDEPYVALRSAVYEERAVFYRYEPFIQELSDLEHNRKKRKVDHPYGGSKDVGDGGAGALFSAQENAGRVPQPAKTVEAMRDLVRDTKEDPDPYWWLRDV